MSDCNTFREELAIRYPKHGYALWDPDPGGLYDSVEVGDVGFIHDGYFYRMFNALEPPRAPPSPSIPTTPDTHHDHNLAYPPKLQPKTSNHIRRSIEPHQEFHSENVTRLSGEPNIHAFEPDDDAVVTVTCSGKQGALLSLPFAAERADTVARGDFGKWLLKHIYDCMKIADDLGLGVNRMEDIILVTGRHLAPSWVSVLFSGCRAGAQVSFLAQVSGNSDVLLQERSATGGDLRIGPRGEDLPVNQCIFLRGYRVVRLLNIWPRLRGLAGPASDIHEPDPEADTSLKVISNPAETDYQDPLHVLLEYIAEQAPDSDMAIVHDDDLEVLASTPLETAQPDVLLRHLQNYAPAIRQVQCELIPRNEDGSGAAGADTKIATVATISDVVFEAAGEDQTTSYSNPKIDWGMPSQKDEHLLASASDLAFQISPPFDEWSFRRRMNAIGKAYRNRAMELIAICRLFSLAAEPRYIQDTELTSVLQVCDTALLSAARVRSGSSPAADESLEVAIRELYDYELKYHPQKATSGTNAVRGRMYSAKQKDEGLSKKRLVDLMLGKAPTNAASLRTVEFHLMESLTSTQPKIVRQVLTNDTRLQEILWNFSRLDKNRLTLGQNPHFYHRLPHTTPNENWDGFTLPIAGNWHRHPIYVITNISGRIFLEFGPNPRAFDNVWNINGTLIFKGVSGGLWSEKVIGAPLQGRTCFWCPVESPPSQAADEVAVVSPKHAWNPVQDWREAIHQVLKSPNMKIRITDNIDNTRSTHSFPLFSEEV